MTGLRGIGRMSRESGLTVSALRFYDGAGVLVPAHVEPRSGYRYYTPEQVTSARLVAAMRRAGMPLDGVRAVLAHRENPTAVDRLLAEHLRHLEQGVDDARRALSMVRTLIDQKENPMPATITTDATELAAALRAVRFAVAREPDVPVLGAVRFEVNGGVLTVAATDRYRLAFAEVSAEPATEAAVATVPGAFADALLAAARQGAVELTLGAVQVTAVCSGTEVRGEAIVDEYPDWRRLIPVREAETQVDSDAVRKALASGHAETRVREEDGVEFPCTWFGLDADGMPQPGERVPEPVGVNREFLLEALDAGGDGQLSLSLDGPLAPIVLRSPRSTSLLMPVAS